MTTEAVRVLAEALCAVHHPPSGRSHPVRPCEPSAQQADRILAALGPSGILALAAPVLRERLAGALRERKAVFGIAQLYGKFNDAYYNNEAAAILAALTEDPK